MNVKAGMRKIAVALRERWCRVIVGHIPRTTNFMCVHIIFKAWWCNLIHINWPKKYSYDLLQGGLKPVALYVPIYDTPNSLLTKLIVDRDTLVRKELGLACLE